MTTERQDGSTAGRLPSSGPAVLPSSGRLLGVDWGEKRIGLALSDPDQLVATPLGTLTRRAGRRFPMQQLRRTLAGETPVGVVVGLPLEADGTEGPAARAAREMGAVIAEITKWPLAWVDERMTTARALTTVRELGGSTRGRKGDVDQLAAVVLLQHFLDGRR